MNWIGLKLKIVKLTCNKVKYLENLLDKKCHLFLEDYYNILIIFFDNLFELLLLYLTLIRLLVTHDVKSLFKL